MVPKNESVIHWHLPINLRSTYEIDKPIHKDVQLLFFILHSLYMATVWHPLLLSFNDIIILYIALSRVPGKNKLLDI